MEHKEHVCPVWVGYLMASPLRKLQQNPDKILSKHIKIGMQILEIGPAMGFFSIPMAKMTGHAGQVYCVDIQQKMLDKLSIKASRFGVSDVIQTRLASYESLYIKDLKNSIDFCLLFAMVHEVGSQEKFFAEVFDALKTDSVVLFAEPSGHVNLIKWEQSLQIAKSCGFKIEIAEKISGCHSSLLKKI